MARQPFRFRRLMCRGYCRNDDRREGKTSRLVYVRTGLPNWSDQTYIDNKILRT